MADAVHLCRRHKPYEIELQMKQNSQVPFLSYWQKHLTSLLNVIDQFGYFLSWLNVIYKYANFISTNVLHVEIYLNCKIPQHIQETQNENNDRKIMRIKIRILRTCVQSKIGRHPFLSYWKQGIKAWKPFAGLRSISSNLAWITTFTMCCLPDWLSALCCLFSFCCI